MAGRYLLIAFRDADTANQYEATLAFSTLEDHGIRSLGQFYRPDVFCECPDKQRVHVNNWKRGKRSGIPVCSNCRRPSRYWRTGLLKRLEVALGKRVKRA